MNLYLFTSGLALEENRVVIFSPSLVFIVNVNFYYYQILQIYWLDLLCYLQFEVYHLNF